jgi:hypothetical protein
MSTATADPATRTDLDGSEPDGAPATGTDYALVGTSSDVTLFDSDAYKVESCEAVLGGITVKVSGQFEEGDEFNIVVPVKVVNVQYDSREKRRRHILHGTELRRAGPAAVGDGEDE